MSQNSVVSESRRSQNFGNELGECCEMGNASNKMTLYLSQSMAVSLTQVKRGMGRETAEDILKILRNEMFDVKHFRKEITSLEKCQSVTKMLVENLGKKE